MSEKKSIYDCPYCGQRSYTPWKKAMAGGLNAKGAVCQSCGMRSVNGTASTVFRCVVFLIAIVIVILAYLFLKADVVAYSVMIGTMVLAFLITGIFDAFFLPLTKSIRNDANH